MRKILPIGFAMIIMLILVTMSFVLADPQGTEALTGTTSRRADPTVQSLDAQAGNVTQVNIDAITITQGWQGYYGNISNVITLDDVNGNTFYNWTDATPTGEVFAARTNSVTWASINCTDAGNISAEETAMELTGQGDSILNTFNTQTHAAFSVGSRSFGSNECNTTAPYNSTGGTTDFVNILLTDGDDIVYSTIVENDADGFTGDTYDFQLLVTENGHGANATVLTPYYFYVELA